MRGQCYRPLENTSTPFNSLPPTPCREQTDILTALAVHKLNSTGQLALL